MSYKENLSPEMHDTSVIMAQRLAMAYVTCSICQGYIRQAEDDMRKLGIFHREVKQKMSYAQGYFDNFIACVRWFFELGSKEEFCNAITKDYEVLEESCDRYMMSGVRLKASEAWNNDDLREEGEYICLVDGAKDTDVMLLKWHKKRRMWLNYVPSQYGGGWMAMTPGVRVLGVLHRHPRPKPQ